MTARRPTRSDASAQSERQEGEGVFGRWVRRKQAAREAEAREAEAPARGEERAETPPGPETADRGRGPARASAGEESAVEGPLPDLPDIDSLGAGSDYKVFLQPGVPVELRRQALRKAWLTDPGVRAYKTYAEYDWDFNAPGYGALRSGDTAEKLVGRLFSKAKDEVGKKDEVRRNAAALGEKDGGGAEDGASDRIAADDSGIERAKAVDDRLRLDAAAQSQRREKAATAEARYGQEKSPAERRGVAEPPARPAETKRRPRRHGSALPEA